MSSNKKINKKLLHGFVKQALSHNKYLEEKEMWEKKSRLYRISKRQKHRHSSPNDRSRHRSSSADSSRHQKRRKKSNQREFFDDDNLDES